MYRLPANRSMTWSQRVVQLLIGRTKLLLLCLVLVLSTTLVAVYHGYSHFVSNVNYAGEPGLASNLGAATDMDYAVLVDAGSSGSRLFVYTWPTPTGAADGGSKNLLQIQPMLQKDGQPVMMKIEPGLSSVAENPDGASDYIWPLLAHAARHVPVAKQRATPVYVMATAGLRLLAMETRERILADLREDIPKNFSFAMPESGAEVISGRQEGIFQWLAINYVLGRFDHDSSGPLAAIDMAQSKAGETPIVFRKKTVGILDMGGASMQIAVELTSKLQAETMQEEAKGAIADINLGCEEHDDEHKYRVFVTTYLGMGANEAKKNYEEELVRQYLANTSRGPEILDPCTQLQLVRNVTAPVPAAAVGVPDVQPAALTQNGSNGVGATVAPSAVTVTIRGSGDFDACRDRLSGLTKRLLHCPGASCLSDQLPMHVELNDFYGFSEFWYTMEDVLKIGGHYQYYKFRKVAKTFCSVDYAEIDRRFREGQYPLADVGRITSQCFKSAWLATVIHQGFEWRTDYAGLRSSANTVRGRVVHWSLGAVLLKTRFLPLGRQVKSGNSAVASHHWLHLNSFTLVLCFGVVLAAILLYLKQLRWLDAVHPGVVGSGSGIGAVAKSGSRSRLLDALGRLRPGKKRTSESFDYDDELGSSLSCHKPLLLDV